MLTDDDGGGHEVTEVTPVTLPALPEVDWRPIQRWFWEMADHLQQVWADIGAWARENGLDLDALLHHPPHPRVLHSMRLRVAWLRAHRSVQTRIRRERAC